MVAARLSFRLPGVQHLSLGDRQFDLASTGTTGHIAYSLAGRVVDFGLILTEASLTETGKPPIAVEHLALGAHEPPPDHGEVEPVTLAFGLAATNLTLPASMRPALGETVAAVAFDGRLSGPLAPGPLPEALAAWRDAGGAIDLDRFQLAWGRLVLGGNATLALDEKLQPLVAASCQMEGIGPTFDALMAAGVIDQEHGPLGKQVLLGMAGADGKLSLPLTLQDGFVYVGPIKLMPVPPIAW